LLGSQPRLAVQYGHQAGKERGRAS